MFSLLNTLNQAYFILFYNDKQFFQMFKIHRVTTGKDERNAFLYRQTFPQIHGYVRFRIHSTILIFHHKTTSVMNIEKLPKASNA